jgi:hypothetical protein
VGGGKAGRKGRAKGGDEPLRNGEVNTVGEEEENGRGVAGAGGGGSREKLGASEMSVVFHELKGLVNKVSEGEKPLAVSFRFAFPLSRCAARFFLRPLASAIAPPDQYLVTCADVEKSQGHHPTECC